MTVWVSYIRIVKSTVRGAFFAPIGRSIKKHRTPAVGTTAGVCYAKKRRKKEDKFCVSSQNRRQERPG